MSPRFHLPQIFKMFSTPPQRPRAPSTRTPIKLTLSVPLPRTSSTIRPAALRTRPLCATFALSVAYGCYSTFVNVLLPSRPRAEPSSTQVRRSEWEFYLTCKASGPAYSIAFSYDSSPEETPSLDRGESLIAPSEHCEQKLSKATHTYIAPILQNQEHRSPIYSPAPPI
ncbi:hypothetical protein FA13DRAFT_351933 [Coprinellus micaceus]|uniref:Uncharacterized protein n=1 Tax=Coprinellus micaceus TaxID=71717 RepID=A0A4Y7TAL9_COPMI|nr:hypothetical protein FA13DRAFT_351933 [Coprinellus micaceus]